MVFLDSQFAVRSSQFLTQSCLLIDSGSNHSHIDNTISSITIKYFSLLLPAFCGVLAHPVRKPEPEPSPGGDRHPWLND